MHSSPVLATALRDSLSAGSGALIVDLGAVTFCSVAGAALLVMISSEAEPAGVRYGLSSVPPRLARTLAFVRGDRPVNCYNSVPDALAAMR